MQLTRNRIIVLLAGLAAVIVVLSIWLSVWGTQEVIITTSDKEASIRLQGPGEPEPTERGIGEFRARLKHGDYTVLAISGDKQTRTLLSLNGNTTAILNLTLHDVQTPQALTSTVARKPIATDTALHYLNTAFGQIDRYVFATRDTAPLVPSIFGLADIHWVTPAAGYVLDDDGNYSYFNGSELAPLPITEVSAFTANKQGAFAYVKDKKVSVHPNATAAAAYSINTDTLDPSLELGSDNHLLIFDTGVDSEGESAQVPPAIYKGDQRQEAASEAIKSLVIGGGVWAPNADKLALSTEEGAYILEVASGKLTRLSTISSPSQSFTWLNNDELLYFFDQNIWRINIQTQTWIKLAHTEESIPTNDAFALSADGKNVLFVTDSSSLEGTIYAIILQ